MKRIKMGYHADLDDHGLFISAPGQDVDDITKPFMLDSRFKGMDMLMQGRVGMNRQTYGSSPPNVETVYYAAVSVPDQGYFPLFYGAVYYTSSNSLGLETNVEYWPSSGIYRETNGTEVKYSGVWMPNRTTIYGQLNLNIQNAGGNAALYYVVLKNNRDQDIGT